jgi:SAM-dependent methyltransferase
MNHMAAVTDHLSILSDAIRVRMLTVLNSRELTVSELCDIVQLPQSTVSRHLKTLSDADWVISRRDGTRRLYSVPLEDIEPSAKRLWELVRGQVEASSAGSDDERRLRQVLARRRSQSEAFFATAAGEWESLRDEMFGSTSHLRALVGLLDSGLTIADLGCGTGRVSEWLALFAEKVIAVDSSKEMLKAARQYLDGQKNVEIRAGSLEKLPIANGEADLAVMMLVLHHLPEPQRALAEAYRTLQAGGRLLILDMLPHDREEYRKTMGHVWLGFSEKQMTTWLRSAGFRETRWRSLPPDSKTKGPSLFVATAKKKE